MDGDRVKDVRIALGSVAPTVVRAARTEAALRGKRLDATLIRAAQQALYDAIAAAQAARSMTVCVATHQLEDAYRWADRILALHEGEGEYQVGEVTGTRYRADEVAEHLASAGFMVEMIEYRDPLPHEHQGRRIYLIGRAA